MTTTNNVVSYDKSIYIACQQLADAVLNHDKTTKADARIALYLTKKYNFIKGFAYPSLDRIAADLGLSKQWVITSIRRLEDLGFFTVKRPARPGRGIANEYYPQFQRFLPSKPEKGSTRTSKKGSTPVYPSESKSDSEAKASESSLDSTISKPKQGARLAAPGALSASLREKLKEVGEVQEWDEFRRKILHNKKIMVEFFPSDMSVAAFESSWKKWYEKRGTWRSLEIACRRLDGWIRNEKFRGEGWGEPWTDRIYG